MHLPRSFLSLAKIAFDCIKNAESVKCFATDTHIQATTLFVYMCVGVDPSMEASQ